MPAFVSGMAEPGFTCSASLILSLFSLLTQLCHKAERIAHTFTADAQVLLTGTFCQCRALALLPDRDLGSCMFMWDLCLGHHISFHNSFHLGIN